MGYSVAEGVYLLVKEFTDKAEPGTPIEIADLSHIGSEFDIRPSLEVLYLHGVLSNPEPGLYIKQQLDHY